MSTQEFMLLNCGVGENSWESLGLQGEPTSPSLRRSILGVHWKDWRWSCNSSTLTIWFEELTHLKWSWCWERLSAGGEGDDRWWDDWMASPTHWTWFLGGPWRWWWTGTPGVLQFMGSQRVGHDWATELNWSHSSIWPREFHRQRSLVGYSPWGCKELDMTETFSLSHNNFVQSLLNFC